MIRQQTSCPGASAGRARESVRVRCSKVNGDRSRPGWTQRLLPLLLLLSWEIASGQDDLFIMEATVPMEATVWYQNHYGDSIDALPEWPFADVFAAPDPRAKRLGGLSVATRTEPYLHFAWTYRPDGQDQAVVWREDVGDWGYGIEVFVPDTVDGWIRLPPGPFGAEAWSRIADYSGDEGFPGYVYSIVGRLLHLSDVPASGHADETAVSGNVLVLSIDEGLVTFRPEVGSDMPCGEEVPEDELPIPVFTAPTSAFIAPSGEPKFRLAYPKGC